MNKQQEYWECLEHIILMKKIMAQFLFPYYIQ